MLDLPEDVERQQVRRLTRCTSIKANVSGSISREGLDASLRLDSSVQAAEKILQERQWVSFWFFQLAAVFTNFAIPVYSL